MSTQIQKQLDDVQKLLDGIRAEMKSQPAQSDYQACYNCWNDWTKKNKKMIQLPFPTAQTTEEHSSNAHHMLIHIVPVERGNWKPDYNNSSQDKWEPRFYMNSSGSGFAYAYCAGWHARADCGSRLCTLTSEMCERIAKEFSTIYKVKMMYEQ